MIKHQRNHDENKLLECEKCCKVFTSKIGFQQHEKTAHSVEQVKKHKCTFCDSLFLNLDFLKIHQRSHTGEKPYNCSFCTKKFSIKGNMLKHEKIHGERKPFECERCGKIYESLTGFKYHKTKQCDQEHEYKCQICDSQFPTMEALKIHLKSHGEKPYSCSICPLSFALKGNLKTHEQRHDKRTFFLQNCYIVSANKAS